MSELDRALERVRQGREQRRRELAGAGARPLSAEDRLGSAFTPGARVFDRVTGQEGEVLGGTTENVVVQPPERAKG